MALLALRLGAIFLGKSKKVKRKEVKSIGMESHSVIVGSIINFVETDLYVSRSRH